MRIGLFLGVCSLVVGCSSEPPTEPLARVDLRPAFNSDNVDAIGLALAPDGTRFIFDETRGLFRLDGDVATEVVSMAAMPNPGPVAPLLLPVTDIVAIAPDQFALTAIGDGYILDTSAMTLTQRFCYLPEGSPTNVMQRTDAVAYDAATQRLYAQPNTFDSTSNNFLFAQFASYESNTGTSVRWYDTWFAEPVTGMYARDNQLVFAQGARISTIDLTTSEYVEVDDLSRFGIESIDGMAIDPATGALVVVDKQADAMFDIAASSLAF